MKSLILGAVIIEVGVVVILRVPMLLADLVGGSLPLGRNTLKGDTIENADDTARFGISHIAKDNNFRMMIFGWGEGGRRKARGLERERRVLPKTRQTT
jgi:hypothetical protein